MPYQELPVSTNQNGEPRKVGFELEFSGVDVEKTGQILQNALQGKLEQVSEVEWILHSEMGDFSVELDWNYLKEYASRESRDDTDSKGIAWLRDTASILVPIEVVYPPLRVDQLALCDNVVEQLRASGAQGTDSSMTSAFGVHINTELPDTSVECIQRYLRAFCLLQSWLKEAHQTNLARQLSTYVQLYPMSYVRKVLKRNPARIKELIQIYLSHNATRNRALDMLPLFSAIDEDQVQASIQDDRIKARETFHYRLPNCEIEKPDWYLSQAWNLWLVVEKLAQDEEAQLWLTDQFFKRDRFLLGINEKKWIKFLDQWLQDRHWV